MEIKNTKLFVGGLPWATEETDLKKLFEEGYQDVAGCGKGSVADQAVITDRLSGRSKGFGFVTMVDKEKAAQAIQSFNGMNYEGRSLNVNEANDKERSPSRERSSFGSKSRFGGNDRGDRGGRGGRY